MQGRIQLAAGILTLLFAASALADQVVTPVSIVVQNSTAISPSTGNTVEVDLTNTNADPITTGGFFLEVTTSDANITFTGANMSTSAEYIFFGDSGDVANSFSFVTTSGAQILDASDFDNSGSGVTVGGGTTVGLADITFDVASGDTNPTVTFALSSYPANSVNDYNSDAEDFTDVLSNGTLTITPMSPATVPEPSSVILMPAPVALLTRRVWMARR